MNSCFGKVLKQLKDQERMIREKKLDHYDRTIDEIKNILTLTGSDPAKLSAREFSILKKKVDLITQKINSEYFFQKNYFLRLIPNFRSRS